MNYKHLQPNKDTIQRGDVSFESGQLTPLGAVVFGQKVYNNFTFRPLPGKWRNPSVKPEPHEISPSGDVIHLLADGDIGFWPSSSMGDRDPADDQERKSIGWLPFDSLPLNSEVEPRPGFPEIEEWLSRQVPPDGLSQAALSLWWAKRGSAYEKAKKERDEKSS